MTRLLSLFLILASLLEAADSRPLGLDAIAARVRAYPRLHLAYRLMERGQLAAARQALEAARRLEPDNADAERAYVVLLHRMKDYSATVAAADRLLSLAPGDGTGFLYRAMAREALGEREAAIADYNLAATDSLPEPDRAFALFALAELHKKAGRPAAVVAALDRLPAGQRSLRSWRMMAEAYQELGRDEAAGQAWRKAQALAPRDPAILQALRDLDYRQGQLRSSVNWSRLLTEIAPTAEHLQFETRLLMQLERYAEVRAVIERRLAADRSAAARRAALLDGAELAQREGNWAEERRWLERAAALGPSSAVYRRLAGLALREGDRTAARDWYRRSLKLQRNPDDLAALATLAYELGDYAEAVSLNREVLPYISLPINQARIWMAIGWAEQQRGRFAAAAAAFREAARRVPPPLARRELATAEQLSGRPQAAAEALREALAADSDPQLRLRLALILSELGDASRAGELAGAALAGLADPKDRALAWRLAAYAQERQGDWLAARNSLEQALAEGGPSAELYRALLELNLRLGDGAAAVRAARQIQNPDFETALQVARAEAAAGNHDAAADQLDRLLGPAPPQDAWRVLAQRAEVEAARNRPQLAAELRLRAAALPQAPRARLLEEAAASLVYVRDFEGARRAYLALAAQEEDRTRLAAVYESLGELEAALGRDAEAEISFQRAESFGADTALRRAYLLLRLDRPQEAGRLFERAYERSLEPDLARAAADAYQRARDFPRALYWLERTLPPAAALAPELRAQRYREAGYLAAESGDDPRALRYWMEAQQLAFDSTVALRLLRAKLRGGQPVTLSELDPIDTNLLGPADRLEYLDLKANLLARAGRDQDAAQLLETALGMERSPARAFELAETYRRLGRARDAIAQYQWVDQQRPGDPAVASPLAYALASVGRPQEATAVLEASLRLHPDQPRLEAQLGYLFRAQARNREAMQAFARALQGLDGQEARQIRYELDALRMRVNYLLYWTFASPGLQDSSFLGPGFGAAVPSQGGAEIAWRPPGIGFRNDRIFHVFTRILWSNRFPSAAVAPESWQGGAGIRYKPFRRLNAFLSGERLFAVGEDALRSWLVRGMYSFHYGESPWITPRPQLYSTAFADVSYFTNRSTWLYFGQGRQGYSFPIRPNLLVSPHAMVEVRYQDRVRQRVGYFQQGAGLALNVALQSDYDQAPRGRLEFLAQYRWGGFFARHPLLSPREDFAGWFLSLALVR